MSAIDLFRACPSKGCVRASRAASTFYLYAPGFEEGDRQGGWQTQSEREHLLDCTEMRTRNAQVRDRAMRVSA